MQILSSGFTVCGVLNLLKPLCHPHLIIQYCSIKNLNLAICRKTHTEVSSRILNKSRRYSFIGRLARKVTKKTDKLAMKSSGFLLFFFLVGICHGEEQGEF